MLLPFVPVYCWALQASLKTTTGTTTAQLQTTTTPHSKTESIKLSEATFDFGKIRKANQ
jgi:hypothetical protein